MSFTLYDKHSDDPTKATMIGWQTRGEQEVGKDGRTIRRNGLKLQPENIIVDVESAIGLASGLASGLAWKCFRV